MACAFINTIVREEEIARQKLDQAPTHYESLSRVYSSSSYYGYLLSSNPNSHRHIDLDSETNEPALDAILSDALDTVLLPHTIH